MIPILSDTFYRVYSPILMSLKLRKCCVNILLVSGTCFEYLPSSNNSNTWVIDRGIKMVKEKVIFILIV